MEQGTIKNSVGKAISQALAITRWTKETLAAEIGVRSSTLRRWANGEVDDFTLIPVAVLFRIAGLSLDEALGLRASVPSKGVDDSKIWRERAEMYEGLLQLLTQQALPSFEPKLKPAGDGMSSVELARLQQVSRMPQELKEQESAKSMERRVSDDGQEQRRTGTG